MNSNEKDNDWQGKKFFKPNTKQYDRTDPHRINDQTEAKEFAPVQERPIVQQQKDKKEEK